MKTLIPWAGVAVLVLALAGCKDKTGSATGESGPDPARTDQAGADTDTAGAGEAAASGSVDPGFEADGSAENLKKFFVELQGSIEKGDTARAAALTRGVMPDEAALKKAFRDDAPADFPAKVLGMIERVMPRDDGKVAHMLGVRPGWTEVLVHGATTEDIASGAPAASEFPGGAKKMAETVLRPGMMFYEVERREPGAERGNRLDLFFFDGSRWVMLGKLWRIQ